MFLSGRRRPDARLGIRPGGFLVFAAEAPHVADADFRVADGRRCRPPVAPQHARVERHGFLVVVLQLQQDPRGPHRNFGGRRRVVAFLGAPDQHGNGFVRPPGLQQCVGANRHDGPHALARKGPSRDEGLARLEHGLGAPGAFEQFERVGHRVRRQRGEIVRRDDLGVPGDAVEIRAGNPVPRAGDDYPVGPRELATGGRPAGHGNGVGARRKVHVLQDRPRGRLPVAEIPSPGELARAGPRGLRDELVALEVQVVRERLAGVDGGEVHVQQLSALVQHARFA